MGAAAQHRGHQVPLASAGRRQDVAPAGPRRASRPAHDGAQRRIDPWPRGAGYDRATSSSRSAVGGARARHACPTDDEHGHFLGEPGTRRAVRFVSSSCRATSPWPLPTRLEISEDHLSRCLDEPACYLLRITWTSVDEHLIGFRKGPEFGAFFAEIKPYIEDIEEMRHYTATAIAGPGGAAPPSLYEWAGGTDAFVRLCDAFYRLVSVDDLLAPMFAHMYPEHARYVAVGSPRFSATGDLHHRTRRLPQHARPPPGQGDQRSAASPVGQPDDGRRRRGRPTGRPGVPCGLRRATSSGGPGWPPATPNPTPTRSGGPVPHWGWGVAPPYQG